MSAAGSHSPSRFSFLKEGLLLPGRNPGLSRPIFTLAVVQTALHVYLGMLPWDGAPVGAVNFLAAMAVGSVVEAISTSAAVAMCVAGNEGRPPAFRVVLINVLKGGLAGPVATAFGVRTVDVACQLVAAVVLAILVNLVVGYTRSLLILDLLAPVVLVAGVARLYLGAVLAVAVAVSAAEPGCRGVVADALRRACALTAGNADQAVIFTLVKGILDVAMSPRHRNASIREPPELVYLLVSGAVQVYCVCAVTAYYYECKGRSQGSPPQPLLIGTVTGREWRSSLPNRCCNKFREVLQGRCSVRRTLATLLAHLRCWSVWMLVFVSSHPWASCVLVVCAGRLILEGPPQIFYPNNLESYRNFFSQTYHIHPEGCANRAIN